MTGWLIVLGILLLFLLLKVGVRLRWDSNDTVLKIRIGLLRFSLSTTEKEKKPKKKKPEKTSKSAPHETQEKKKKGISPTMKSWIRALLDLWRELFALIGRVLTVPTLDLLRLCIAVAGGEPDACAMKYGKICAGLSVGLPVLYNTFRVRKQDIDVSCRFDLPQMEIMAEVEATVRIYEIFALIGVVIGLLLKLYLTKKNYDKAVQNV